ncbi:MULTISPECIES: M23 family metallopeptidase [Gracilibacillus]|uniref:M23 family metallopeptidase n=1 Tax=Gracilibacillus TaxID=74385 RepID=UPI000826D8EC|nr:MULTISPECIES: M23 family metallopeptidase [Gracilibacillus]
MKENKSVPKNKWKRLFQKKWFFPAVYLVAAAFVLTGVLWYQQVITDTPDIADNARENVGDSRHDQTDDESAPVMQQQEVLQMPVAENLQTEIVTKFYDYGADVEDQQDALILHENKYYQSDGIAISTSDHEAFDVMASLSGTVTEIKHDPLLGNVVKMEHEEGISTYYASLDDVVVEEGSELKQGDSLGTAGQNTLGQDNGVHVHFEVRKDGTPVNPEEFINQPIQKITAPEKEEEEQGEVNQEEVDQEESGQEESAPDENENADNPAEDSELEEELPNQEPTEEETDEEASQELSFRSEERV